MVNVKNKCIIFVHVFGRIIIKLIDVINNVIKILINIFYSIIYSFLYKLTNKKDTFVLYRIIGNDLPPRHKSGQTYNNLKFILENEPDFDNCEKIWVLNRIMNSQEYDNIEGLLQKYNRKYITIQFDREDYKQIDFIFDGIEEPSRLLDEPNNDKEKKNKSDLECYIVSKKNIYTMNNNGARNAALKHGKNRAIWILPWDGNCFLTKPAWEEITTSIKKKPWLKYFIVPMARVTDNTMLLQIGFKPKAQEEPQIIFRKNSMETFNESFPYGQYPKVELLKRIGVPGIWDNTHIRLHPWDKSKDNISKKKNQYGLCGWVARLSSGNEIAEQSPLSRAISRNFGIVSFLKVIDVSLLQEKFNKNNYAYYSHAKLENILTKSKAGEIKFQKIINEINARADEILLLKPYSVVNKTTLPPSGNIHDYWHPSPYYWPNPETHDGLPYIYKDGERAPGTRLYEKESEKYDRTSLQRMFDETTILSLSYFFTKDIRYAKKAAEFIRTWFIDKNSKMNPHLKYSQIRMGIDTDHGSNSGLIETKDFYFFLDAVKIISGCDIWTKEDDIAMKSWCSEFLYWLLDSEQGRKERQSKNNHGVCYDLQIASLAAYLGELSLLYDIGKRARIRLMDQINADGMQPYEIKRTITFHYFSFNLQSWLNLALLLENTIGVDLWSFSVDDKGSIEKALNWLLPYYNNKWPYRQIDEFNKERLVPLFYISRNKYLNIWNTFKENFPDIFAVPSCFFPHDGIPVFWILNAVDN